MIARIARPALLALPIALAFAAFAPASHARPHPAPPTPAYSPPPSEESPYSHADNFCVRSANRFDAVTSTEPPLRSQPAVVVWLTAGVGGGPASEDGDVETFARLVDRCGGIGGRPLDVHVVHTSDDPAVDCAEVVGRYHPVMVVATSLPPAWSCIVHDQRTILVTGSDVSNADLTGAGGRLVATGSSEGVEQARLLALVDSGRLSGRKVAIVAGNDATASEFRRSAVAALATKHIRPVSVADADAVLVPTLELGALPLLSSSTTPTSSQPLDVYSFGTADASVPAALEAQPASSARLLRSVRLYAFSPVADRAYRASQSPNTFSGMCNRAAVDEDGARGLTTTTTTEPRPPLSASYLTTS
ncbi:MAG TPA: hypothetical protein VFW97_12160 [Acidimicrobiia bacterium]|nr:hypothetical protein [Acidimicrobiia bacterium]